MRSFTATANDDGVRLSRFVQNVTLHLPASLLHKSFRNKRIKVNGKKQTPEYRLATGDIIELYLNDEFFTTSIPTPTYPHSNNNFTSSIVLEDANIAVLYKPEGILCHGANAESPSLLQDFIQHLIQTGAYNPQTENQFSPALCNRLDQGTEGLVLAAKTYAALRDTNELLRNRLVDKTYLCVVCGTPPQGTATAFLTRDTKSKHSYISLENSPKAKEISTGIRILESNNSYSLCEINLITGRTHQIRAHLAFLGYPILGDHKYYTPESLSLSSKLPSQLLSAYSIVFSVAIPETSSLAYLAGKKITAPKCKPLSWWRLQG